MAGSVGSNVAAVNAKVVEFFVEVVEAKIVEAVCLLIDGFELTTGVDSAIAVVFSLLSDVNGPVICEIDVINFSVVSEPIDILGTVVDAITLVTVGIVVGALIDKVGRCVKVISLVRDVVGITITPGVNGSFWFISEFFFAGVTGTPVEVADISVMCRLVTVFVRLDFGIVVFVVTTDDDLENTGVDVGTAVSYVDKDVDFAGIVVDIAG